MAANEEWEVQDVMEENDRRTLRPIIRRYRCSETYGGRRGQRVRVTKWVARHKCTGSLLA